MNKIIPFLIAFFLIIPIVKADCTDNSTCSGNYPVCNTTSSQCVECLSDSDCSSNNYPNCLQSIGECYGMVGDYNCTQFTNQCFWLGSSNSGTGGVAGFGSWVNINIIRAVHNIVNVSVFQMFGITGSRIFGKMNDVNVSQGFGMSTAINQPLGSEYTPPIITSSANTNSGSNTNPIPNFDFVGFISQPNNLITISIVIIAVVFSVFVIRYIKSGDERRSKQDIFEIT